MTILYARKTIVTCTQCSFDYVWPNQAFCPNCGDPLELLPVGEAEIDPHGATRQFTPPSPDPSTGGRGREHDGFSRKLVYVGIGLCLAMIGAAYWHPIALDPILERLGIPSFTWAVLRILIYGLALSGLAQGVLSLIFWRSGPRWYRRVLF